MSALEDEKAKKAAKKAKLKAEAEKLGISYDELKAQKKEKKKRKREAEQLNEDIVEHDGGADRLEEKKRMRAYSGDFDADKMETGDNAATAADEAERATKRLRTRSMDKAEENHKIAIVEKSQTTEEWRKSHNITVRGYGKNDGGKFEDPFIEFDDAPFNPTIQKTLKAAGFERPTFIQSQAWPIAIKGTDMISIAKTGSGKTCGFLLPSFHQYIESKKTIGMGLKANKGPMMLVLAPTRELACQILDETQKFGRPNGIRSVCCYGGSPKYPQIAALERGVECVIATPGRINDLIEMKKANLSSVKFVVLDEADRMLDMGFEPQIRSIMAHVPDSSKRQTLLFSATWPKEIQRLAFDFLQDPIQINVGEINVLNANKDITQNIIMCSEDDKIDKLKEILTNLVNSAEDTKEESPKPQATAGGNRYTQKPVDLGGKKHSKVIVFVAKKYVAHELANQLWDEGFAVDSLHGDRAQWERTKVINAFKQGTLRMLIATDVAARGLDVKDVGAVVNYDMPVGVNGAEDYIHRIGRTGRAGAKGIAHTFFTPGDKKLATELVEILKKAGQEVPEELQRMVRPKFHPGRGGFGRGGRGRGGGRGYGGGGGGRGYMSGGGGRGGGGGGGGGFGRGRGGRGFGRGR